MIGYYGDLIKEMDELLDKDTITISDAIKMGELSIEEQKRVWADNEVVYCLQPDKRDINTNKFIEMMVIALKKQYERDNHQPLTLAELKQMEGEPAWVISLITNKGWWELLNIQGGSIACRDGLRVFANYGNTWVAYAYEPKEEQG